MVISEAIKEFVEDRKYRNVSVKTLDAYQLILRMFKDFADSKDIVNIEDVTSATVKSFLLYLQDRGNNAVSRNSKLRSLKSWFNYLESIDVFTLRNNPTKRIPYAKENIELKPFTDEQIAQMLGYLKRQFQRNKSFVNKRNYTCIVFLLGSGVRIGEMVNLKWTDIDFESTMITVLGKKREYSSVPVSDKLIKELAEYKAFVEQSFGKVPQFVFCNDEGKEWQVDSAKCFFKRLKKVMNFDVRLSAHTFRITYAVLCLKAGMDAFTLQRCLRHTTLDMSNRYIRMFGSALKSQVEKFNPLNGVDL